MRSADVRATDKQNCDATMHELKQLSRDFHLPILLISSFNRDSYWTPVDMNCFKESGSIEYGCDVLLALQYDGMKAISSRKAPMFGIRQCFSGFMIILENKSFQM